MAEGSLITEEMRSSFGKLVNMTINRMVEEEIERYIEAMEETNPLYYNEEYARKSSYHGTIVPPGFITTARMTGGGHAVSRAVPFEWTLKRGVDAGAEYEFYQVVRPGDIIVTTTKMLNISEREGKTYGKMLLVEWEETHTNQRREVVAKAHKRAIRY